MYHELVFHLDLCILSYQQYAQTLIWPFDPYYERMALVGASRRETFMAGVRAHFTNGLGNGLYYGPGPAFDVAWAPNNVLDPIMARYDKLYPWNPGFTRAEKTWIYYRTPSEITNKICSVRMCQYVAGAGDPSSLPNNNAAPFNTVINTVANRPGAHANDVLYCFEGGTGCVINTASVWSLMGCILERETATGYDVHIVFRGSRSGSGVRAASQGLGGKGNPDWVTDMDLSAVVQEPYFAAYGSVCRGFSRAVKTCIPTVIACLQAIHAARGAPPQNIYVTGHSLGGALATQFTIAMVMGTVHGPNGSQLPGPLPTWPWDRIRLITFSAPVTGGKSLARNFNSRIYCRRVVLSQDPITTEKINHHVGQEIYITGENTINILSYHEPANVRERLIRKIQNWGDPVNAITARTPHHVAWPWRVYNTFDAMYQSEQILQNPARLRRILTGVDTDAQHYLTIAAQTFNDKHAYKRSTLQQTRQDKRDAVLYALARVGGTVGLATPLLRWGQLAWTLATLRASFGETGKHLAFVTLLCELAQNPQLTWPELLQQQLVRDCIQ